MALTERSYFIILIPVTLVILINIMAFYTVTEMKRTSQLNSEQDQLNGWVHGMHQDSRGDQARGVKVKVCAK